MNNLVKIYENIIIDNDTRIGLQEYYQMQGSQIPNFVRFDASIYQSYNKISNLIREQLNPGWGLRNPLIADPEEQAKFYKTIKAIFETSTKVKPILTKYIFEYHVVDSADEKNNAINSLTKLLTQINKAYNDNHLNTPTEERYIDGEFNLNADKLTNAMERRIEEIFKMAQESNIAGDDREVFRILKKYNLL
jgi:hypothetical protein